MFTSPFPKNKILAKFVISFLLLFSTSSMPVVILIHGSFASQSNWCRPHGNFYQELEKQANQLNQRLVSFSWPGTPTYDELSLAAESLIKLLLSYPTNEQIILIGHSHGGNIINLASQFLYDPIEDLLEQATGANLSTYLQQATHNLQQASFNSSITNAYNVSALSKPEHDLTYTTRRKSQTIKKKYFIDRVYLLGTPVDISRYNPCMKTIHELYNFYSQGDHIQPVLGLYQRTYPTHERIANLSITIKNIGFLQSNQPSHTTLHHPIIAQWLLAIPSKLKEEKLGNFENFSFGNGKINLEEGKNPIYQPNLTRPIKGRVTSVTSPVSILTQQSLKSSKFKPLVALVAQ